MLPITEPLDPSLPLSDWALESPQSMEGSEDELAITSFCRNKHILWLLQSFAQKNVRNYVDNISIATVCRYY